MKYEVATAEAPRTARRRAGFADAAERDEVCIERRKDALAIVLSMVVGGRATKERRTKWVCS